MPFCQSWILPTFQGAAAAGTAAQGSAPRRAGPSRHWRLPANSVGLSESQQRQFSVGSKEQRRRRRRRAVSSAFPATRAYLCPLSAPVSLIHPTKLADQGGLALSQKNRLRRTRHSAGLDIGQLLSARRWQAEHPGAIWHARPCWPCSGG